MSIEDKMNAAVDAVITRRNDPEQMAIAIEKISKALGLAVAFAGHGDAEKIDELMIGAENYAHSTAVDFSGLAALVRLKKLEGK